MTLYVIIYDTNRHPQFFNGFSPNSNNTLIPRWDSGRMCVFDTLEEAEYSVSEIGYGNVIKLQQVTL